MSKWIRVEDNAAQEIITYDPNGVINETFLPLFKGPFADDLGVEIGYVYNSSSNAFSEPPIPEPVVAPEVEEEEEEEATPEPTYINEAQFRGQLTLSEKLVWDNPSEGTSVQKSAINTVLRDFPHLVDGTEFKEELDLLESTEVIGTGRAATLLTYFSSL
jgi:hypothetical protein